MIGTFGTIEEDIGADAEGLTHEQRFGVRDDSDPRFSDLQWRSGRDLLLLEIGPAGVDTSVTLPPRPKRVTGNRLWVPLRNDDEQAVGPIYQVGVEASGPLLRVRAETTVRFVSEMTVVVGEVRAETTVRFVSEMTVVVGERRAVVLGQIDGLDPSSRRQLEKVIQRSKRDGLSSQVLFPERTGALRSPSLPPAATTILATIEREPLGTSHVLPYQRRGATSLVNLLEERGMIRVFPSGQIVANSRYQELCDALDDPNVEYDSRRAATIWKTSVGMAAALLDQLARDGMVDKVSARNYKVN